MAIILTADKKRNDGAAFDLMSKVKSKYPIVLVSRSEDLDFEESILSLKGQPYILVDYVELGYDWHMKFGHHWGINTDKFNEVFHMDSWKVFDDFIRDNPPILTFQRELLKDDVTDKLLPIQYPCFLPPEPMQLFEDFNARRFEVIFSWGLSHEYRKELHGEIWKQAGRWGYSVCDNIYYMNGFLQYESCPKKWLTINIPHYARLEMKEFIKINGMAKISISIAGAGRNCFRHCESPINSVMLMWEDNLAWHEEWKHGINCIKCKQGTEIDTTVQWLHNRPKELYDIYIKGVQQVDKYRFDNYIPFLEKIINNAWK